jgi:hypothetical protein
MLIKFPIIRKNKNPVEEFYKNSLLSSIEFSQIDYINVNAFTVNPKDDAKLLKLLTKYMKTIFVGIPISKIKYESSYLLMDMGPRVSSNIPEGFVEIDKEVILNANTKK